MKANGYLFTNIEAQSTGFPLNPGQSHVNDFYCISDADMLTRYSCSKINSVPGNMALWGNYKLKQDVRLYLKFDGNLTDSSPYLHVATVVAPAPTYSTDPSGTFAIFNCTGHTGYLSYPSSIMNFGNKDFSISFDGKSPGYTSTDFRRFGNVISNNNSAAYGTRLDLGANSTTGAYSYNLLMANASGTAWEVNLTNSLTYSEVSNWQHYEIRRTGTKIEMLMNGIVVNSANVAANYIPFNYASVTLVGSMVYTSAQGSGVHMKNLIVAVAE